MHFSSDPGDGARRNFAQSTIDAHSSSNRPFTINSLLKLPIHRPSGPHLPVNVASKVASAAGWALCGPYWVPLVSTESPQARAGRTVLDPGTTKIKNKDVSLFEEPETLKSER